jgi:hypothetical protein
MCSFFVKRNKKRKLRDAPPGIWHLLVPYSLFPSDEKLSQSGNAVGRLDFNSTLRPLAAQYPEKTA